MKMDETNPDLSREADAKLVSQYLRWSHFYAKGQMAKIRSALGLRHISVLRFCEFYRIDPILFTSQK